MHVVVPTPRRLPLPPLLQLQPHQLQRLHPLHHHVQTPMRVHLPSTAVPLMDHVCLVRTAPRYKMPMKAVVPCAKIFIPPRPLQPVLQPPYARTHMPAHRPNIAVLLMDRVPLVPTAMYCKTPTKEVVLCVAARVQPAPRALPQLLVPLPLVTRLFLLPPPLQLALHPLSRLRCLT